MAKVAEIKMAKLSPELKRAIEKDCVREANEEVQASKNSPDEKSWIRALAESVYGKVKEEDRKLREALETARKVQQEYLKNNPLDRGLLRDLEGKKYTLDDIIWIKGVDTPEGRLSPYNGVN